VGGLLRVAAGLDSVAQGEHAIGNQILRAFERAHEAGTVCRNLHVMWRGVGEMLNHARRILPQGRSGGVQALVVQRMLDVPREATVAVFGLGEIGRAMLRALADAGFTAVESFNRASMRAFESAGRRRADRDRGLGRRVPGSRAGRSRAHCGLRSRQSCNSSMPRGWEVSPCSMNCWMRTGAVLPKINTRRWSRVRRVRREICQTLLQPPPSDTLAAMTAMRTEIHQNKHRIALEEPAAAAGAKATSETHAAPVHSAARREP
jgi:hypothetical protein